MEGLGLENMGGQNLVWVCVDHFSKLCHRGHESKHKCFIMVQLNTLLSTLLSKCGCWCCCLSGINHIFLLYPSQVLHWLCYQGGRCTFSYFTLASHTLQWNPTIWVGGRKVREGRTHCPVSGANPGRCIPTIPYHTLPTLPYLTHIRHHTWWGESRRLLRPHSIVPSHVIWHRPLRVDCMVDPALPRSTHCVISAVADCKLDSPSSYLMQTNIIDILISYDKYMLHIM